MAIAPVATIRRKAHQAFALPWHRFVIAAAAGGAFASGQAMLPICTQRGQDRCIQHAKSGSVPRAEPTSSSPTLPSSGVGEAAAKAFIFATSKSPDLARSFVAPQSFRVAPGPTIGVAFSTMPAGAEVVAIMPGSPAMAARLSPGMTITSVNGVPLAGMSPEAMAAAVKAPTRSITYGIAGGAPITVQRASSPPDVPALLRVEGSSMPD